MSAIDAHPAKVPGVNTEVVGGGDILPSEKQRNHYFESDLVEQESTIKSRIAKVTSIYYNKATHMTKTYEEALMSHYKHDNHYGYKHFVQRRGELGPWSKHSYLLRILVTELAKPPSDRLDWLFWHDADIVLMNDLLPLETFLPPKTPDWDHINLLVNNDLGGLNDGAFFVRVCDWSVYLFAGVLSYPYYRPEKPIRHDEQGAFNNLIRETKWKDNIIHVPQRWFNTYQDFGTDDTIPAEWHFVHDYFEPGDLLVHLAGTTQDSRPFIMQEWFERLKTDYAKYNIPLAETKYVEKTKLFWETDALNEFQRQDDYWRYYWLVNNLIGPKEDFLTEQEELRIKEEMSGNYSQEAIEQAIKLMKDERKEAKQAALRVGYKDMVEGRVEDRIDAE
ncbi:hypothetical protein H2198_006999 [Neophaeococcomyces mojaviensis]|uniref:Uncharacterized protein n=1 Tax=Neophaeococcomyces mojaviensis TaxID=3383035 RepID=A0ACC3A1R1_9EURO|nr:hypothetical protein H2198_006999 [Knufia sp. JES_112]